MSYFYGTVKGTKGEATRCGHKSSGMHTQAASYAGCVDVQLNYDEKVDQDMASVWITPWQGSGVRLRLYEGPLNPQPVGDVNAALRCRTCVNFNKWKPVSNGPEAHCGSSAPEEGE